MSLLFFLTSGLPLSVWLPSVRLRVACEFARLAEFFCTSPGTIFTESLFFCCWLAACWLLSAVISLFSFMCLRPWEVSLLDGLPWEELDPFRYLFFLFSGATPAFSLLFSNCEFLSAVGLFLWPIVFCFGVEEECWIATGKEGFWDDWRPVLRGLGVVDCDDEGVGEWVDITLVGEGVAPFNPLETRSTQFTLSSSL